MMYTAQCSSPLGALTLAGDGDALLGLWLNEQKYYGLPYVNEEPDPSRPELLAPAIDWLRRYFQGERPDLGELRLAPRGSDFQKQVWRLLCGIPYGSTVSYGELARQIAAQRGIRAMSAQAVGGAVGHNPIGIIIPCHRVIGSDGSLTGYAGGLDKKLWLLRHEGAIL